MLFNPINFVFLTPLREFENEKIYNTIIFSVVLYGFKTWSLTLTEKGRLMVFENRILRRIFGPKRDAKEEWRRIDSEGPNIVRGIKSRRLRWAG